MEDPLEVEKEYIALLIEWMILYTQDKLNNGRIREREFFKISSGNSVWRI